MRKHSWLCIMVLVTAGILPADAVGEDMVMGEPVVLARAGISLSLPADCEIGPLGEPNQLLLAVQDETDQQALGVTLSAFPVGPKMTADQFADVMIAYLQEQLVLRDMEVVASPSLKVAELAGAGRVLSYDLRGQETVAASVCFVRPLADEDASICYVLTVEALGGKSETIQQTLEAVIATVSLQAIEPTSLADSGELDEPMQMPQLGFSIRPPEQWYAAAGPAGVQMGQLDYTLGEEIIPAAQLTVTLILPGEDAQTCASQALETAKQTGEASGFDVEVLAQGPAGMAGQVGYQFILRQSAEIEPISDDDDADQEQDDQAADGQAAEDGAYEQAAEDGFAADESPAVTSVAVIIAHRVICLNDPDEPGGPRSYSLTLVCRGADAAIAAAKMDELAGGFELIPIIVADERPAEQDEPAGDDAAIEPPAE